MSVKNDFLFLFYRLSNITVSCFLEFGCDDMDSILTKSHKPCCDNSFICGDGTHAKEFLKLNKSDHSYYFHLVFYCSY